MRQLAKPFRNLFTLLLEQNSMCNFLISSPGIADYKFTQYIFKPVLVQFRKLTVQLSSSEFRQPIARPLEVTEQVNTNWVQHELDFDKTL